MAGNHLADRILVAVLAVQNAIPDWLRAPGWLIALSHALRVFIRSHEAAGLFSVIFVEELGIPLPVPGDIAIMWGGYLTGVGRISYGRAYVSVVAGATLGSTVLFLASRALGHRALVRYGRFIGLNAEKLAHAESAFRRWGAWAIIIGRLIPGMRIILSAFAGAFNVPVRVFVPSVFVSSLIWAGVFLELGRRLGRRTLQLFQLLPAHLLPWALLVLGIAIVTAWVYERRILSRSRRASGTIAHADQPT